MRDTSTSFNHFNLTDLYILVQLSLVILQIDHSWIHFVKINNPFPEKFLFELFELYTVTESSCAWRQWTSKWNVEKKYMKYRPGYARYFVVWCFCIHFVIPILTSCQWNTFPCYYMRGIHSSQPTGNTGFGVSFYFSIKKRLNKKSRCWWFKTPWPLSWGHCNASPCIQVVYCTIVLGLLHLQLFSWPRATEMALKNISNIGQYQSATTYSWGGNMSVLPALCEVNPHLLVIMYRQFHSLATLGGFYWNLR